MYHHEEQDSSEETLSSQSGSKLRLDTGVEDRAHEASLPLQLNSTPSPHTRGNEDEDVQKEDSQALQVCFLHLSNQKIEATDWQK